MIKCICIVVFWTLQSTWAYSQSIDTCDLLKQVLSDSIVVTEMLFNKEGMHPIIIKQTKRFFHDCFFADTLGRPIVYQTIPADSLNAELKKDRPTNESVFYISDLMDAENNRERKVWILDPRTKAVVNLYFKIKKGKLYFIRRGFGRI